MRELETEKEMEEWMGTKATVRKMERKNVIESRRKA